MVLVTTLARLRAAMLSFGTHGYSATIGMLCKRQLERKGK